MKPDWAALIRQHTRPSRDKAAGGQALTLEKGIVGMSIAAGSARRARIPFLFLARGSKLARMRAGSRSTCPMTTFSSSGKHATRCRRQIEAFAIKHYVPDRSSKSPVGAPRIDDPAAPERAAGQSRKSTRTPDGATRFDGAVNRYLLDRGTIPGGRVSAKRGVAVKSSAQR